MGLAALCPSCYGPVLRRDTPWPCSTPPSTIPTIPLPPDKVNTARYRANNTNVLPHEINPTTQMPKYYLHQETPLSPIHLKTFLRPGLTTTQRETIYDNIYPHKEKLYMTIYSP